MRSQDSVSLRSMTSASYGDLHQPLDAHRSSTSSASLSGSITLSAMGTGTVASNAAASSAGSSKNGPNWSKLQALKQRKAELEKLLSEKNAMLQQIQKQETQILNGSAGTVDHYSLIEEDANLTTTRKTSTSFKLPKAQAANRDDADIEMLLHDKRVQQEISSTSLRLMNDPNVSKSIRRTHKAEYDQAQQKLLSINQNLSLLKRRQMTHSKSTSETVSVSSSSSQVLKSPSFSTTSSEAGPQRGYQEKDKKYGSNNSVNSYYNAADRRNSTKSIKSTSAVGKNVKQSDSLSLVGDRTLKQHRSDFDLNTLGAQLQQQPLYYQPHQRQPPPALRAKKPAHPNYSDYQENYVNNNSSQRNSFQQDIGDYYSQLNNNHSVLHSPNSTRIPCDKYYLSPHSDEIVAGGASFMKSNQNTRQYSVHTSNETETQSHTNTQLYPNDPHPLPNRYSQRLASNSNFDAISLSPSNVSSLMDQPHQIQRQYAQAHAQLMPQQQPAGLGGYWRVLANNERVWCAFDNGYDNGTYNTKGRKLSSPSVSQSISSSSLGNYSLSTTNKDDCMDEISISSLNSEMNKKPKEKQWLETSLDGPTVKAKPPQLSPDSCNYEQLSPSPNMDSISMHQMGAKSFKPQRSKLSSQSMSTGSYRLQPKPKIEDQHFLSQSTSVLNHLPPPPTLPPKLPQPLPLPPPDTSSLDAILNASKIHSPRARQPQAYLPPPISIDGNHNISPTPKIPPMDIRIESPQNITVIQQATFMPYKEESKPFEMSDFYKYSTKFRQREAEENAAAAAQTHHNHNMYLPKQPMPLPTEVE